MMHTHKSKLAHTLHEKKKLAFIDTLHTQNSKLAHILQQKKIQSNIQNMQGCSYTKFHLKKVCIHQRSYYLNYLHFHHTKLAFILQTAKKIQTIV